MTIQVIEIQNRKTTRTYNLQGPKLETVKSFWDYLKGSNVIESYEIKEV